MDPTTLLEYLVGPFGAIVVMAVVIFYLFQQNKELRKENNDLKDERLNDAMDAKKLAEAMLERLGKPPQNGGSS